MRVGIVYEFEPAQCLDRCGNMKMRDASVSVDLVSILKDLEQFCFCFERQVTGVFFPNAILSVATRLKEKRKLNRCPAADTRMLIPKPGQNAIDLPNLDRWKPSLCQSEVWKG